MTVCERAFRELKFELPSTSVRRFVVTPALVNEPKIVLAGFLAEQEREQRATLRAIVQEFADRFRQSHGLTLAITEGAAEWLVDEAQRTSRPVRDLCAERFKDFQFGLRLIAQNSGQSEFIIDETTVKDPEKALSSWVVASYRGIGAEAGADSKGAGPVSVGQVPTP